MADRLDAATRARRLISLLPLLKQGETVSIPELARAVGCSTDDVVSDLTTLTMCGVPPFTPFDMIDLDIEGDTVTVYIEAPALDQPVRLTPREARALGAALEAAGYGPESALRTRLAEAASADIDAAEIERTVRAGATPGGLAEAYSMLATAADEHERLRITYLTGSTGRISERIVQPWALVNRMGVWYLVALCESVGEERVFRIDRIRSIEPTGEHFPPPAVVPLAVVPETQTLPVAVVRIAAGTLPPDSREWPGVVTESQPDGSIVAQVPYQSTGWVARRIVSMMGAAEVLEPPEVRQVVHDIATAILPHAR